MKKLKISLLILFIFTAFSASAQLSFRVKGGLNLSNANVGNETFTINTRINPGFHLAVNAEYMLNENMGIQSGLSFSTAGYKIAMYNNLGGGKLESSAKINLNTLQVPLHFAYSMKLSEQYIIRVHGGPYLAYILSGENIIKVNAISTSKQKTSSEKSIDLYGKDAEFKRFDAGIGIGITLDYTKYFVDLGYDLGLVNLWKDASSKERYTKLNNIYLSVGYKF